MYSLGSAGQRGGGVEVAVVAKPKSIEEVDLWVRGRFGVSSLRERQAEVVYALLRGRRALFVAPTGHGKSLCYQALAAGPWSTGMVLVFQPLKALMAEQVSRATGMGLRAAVVNSDQSIEEQRATLARAVAGELDILFLAPERQGSGSWMEAVPQVELKGVVIDEAHCISQWGHDFRPWYSRLVHTIMGLGRRTPVLAITATAPPKVVADVQLQIAPNGERITSIRLASHRPNITCAATRVDGLAQRLALLLELARGSFSGEPGIAYTLTTREAERAAAFLRAMGVPAEAYWGRRTVEERSAAMDSWLRSDATVMCATSALGMGLDRADVRWVVHLGLPDSLIRYVQEIGRIGRDGEPAWAVAVHDPQTAPVHRWMLGSSWPDPADYRAVVDSLKEGPAKQREIIDKRDIPETVMGKILGDLLRRELVQRDGGSPNTYTWVGGEQDPVPEGATEARALRAGFLQEVFAYEGSQSCRARHLAGAMQDDVLPDACGGCDRCAEWTWPDLAAAEAAALRFLTESWLQIKLRGKYGGAGCALSYYGDGAIGAAVKRAKYKEGIAPVEAFDAAKRVLAKTEGPFVGVDFDAVVCLPPTASGAFVAGFAGLIATHLGVPLVKLERTRNTPAQKSFRSRLKKRQNMSGAFCRPAGLVGAECVLLVDDIWDSGEAMKEAARMLSPAVSYPMVMARTRSMGGS